MSGSRSTRDTGGGSPAEGAPWPSEFTGPAQYSPSYAAVGTAEIEEPPYPGTYNPYDDPYGYPPEARPDPYGDDFQQYARQPADYTPYPLDAGEPGAETRPGAFPGPRAEPQPRRTRAASRPKARAKTTLGGRAVQGLVLASLIGGATAFVALEKTVSLSVDGSVRQVHSFASSVGAVLAGDGVNPGGHDLVTPALGTALIDGSTITVRYGRQVHLTVNGAPSDVWVHFPTVGAALQELGIRTQGARLSAPAGAPIGRSGLTLSVFTMRHLTFLVDGRSVAVDTTAATVGDALVQAGITLRDQDSPSVPVTSVPTDGETVSILRITGTTEVKQVSIPYQVTKVDDPGTYVGSTSVQTPGVNGVAQITYALQIVNGVKQQPKEISRVVTKAPVTEVEKVGTKTLPTNVSQLNWAALANCESGGNPRAVDPSGTYYGLYQFSVSTWASLGGSGLPSNASSAEQTTRAELLYERSGSGQWPVCGHNLFS